MSVAAQAKARRKAAVSKRRGPKRGYVTPKKTSSKK